ncbi:helix-turn-helix domain-containing protein [Streptomyces sp. AC558_RSS880]|uniref:helix-turn-helix domain-containing protein n=1 Tax=Streptomyces sp. AC558_RSS880 TaxID=2823687 RepID=UPI0020B753F0|nr:helix-turn-helix domain-containing protein [Streptomyces sp. AC558_RSS880]
MDTQNTSVRPHAQSRIGGKTHSSRHARAKSHPGGVTHDNTRHTTRFTVIGNHLTQHPDLSLLAIGLACHIQSLPTGTPVGIKSLTARFPEGPTRIATALNELETHGYLRRTRERTPTGRIVTRTVSCNQPGRRDAPSEPNEAPAPPARRAATAPQREPARRRALPAVPKPAYTSPDLLQAATDVLAGLRREDPRLLLSATDAEHLAPGVVAWLERDLTPTAVRKALAGGLPLEPLIRPAAFLAHRLTAKLPPLPPYRAPEPPAPARHPLRNCDICDHAYRGPDPHHCQGCGDLKILRHWHRRAVTVPTAVEIFEDE